LTEIHDNIVFSMIKILKKLILKNSIKFVKCLKKIPFGIG